MRTIQKYLPNPRHTEIKRIFVREKPVEAWEVVRRFDASDITWIRSLFQIRLIPEKILGKNDPHADHRIGISSRSYFMLQLSQC